MSEPSNSPAVQSMREEQNRQRAAAGSGTLDKGLEATLPASDPVSTTITSIPAGRADVIGMVQSDRAADLPTTATTHWSRKPLKFEVPQSRNCSIRRRKSALCVATSPV